MKVNDIVVYRKTVVGNKGLELKEVMTSSPIAYMDSREVLLEDGTVFHKVEQWSGGTAKR